MRERKGYCKKRTVGRKQEMGGCKPLAAAYSPLTNFLQILLLIIGSGKSNRTLYNGEFDPGSG